MKIRGYLIIAISLLAGSLFSQTTRKASNPDQPVGGTTISWKPALQEQLPGAGKKTLLNFDNAQYDLQRHSFPIYYKQERLPSGFFSADAVLTNEAYQPLTDAEKTILSGYGTGSLSLITDKIVPSVYISWQKKQAYASVQFIPIRKNNTTGQFEKLISFSLQVVPVNNTSGKSSFPSTKTYAANSVLTSGKWHRVSVTADGVYKMDYFFLKNMGLNMDSLDPKLLRIFGNGGGQLPFANSGFRHDDLQENAIYVFGQADGKFDSTDYVLFYGQSQHRWKYSVAENKFHHSLNIYSDTTYYFINADMTGPGKRISLQNSSLLPVTNTVTSFDDFQFHEIEANNLIKSGRVWMGETFDVLSTYNFTFNFPNIQSTSKVYAKIETGARRDTPGTDFSWSAGSASSFYNIAGVVTTNIFGPYYRIGSDTLYFFPSSGSIQVSVSKTTPSPAIGWLNYIELNARRDLAMSGTQMIFRDMASADTGNVSQFIISNATSSVQVWDVTDPLNIKSQQDTLIGSSLEFVLPTDSLLEFIAFNGQSFMFPKFSGEVTNQDLHASVQSDLLIVTNPLFLKQANDLADLHRTQDNMIVTVATTQQVFNEFSSGSQDVSAIRDFVKMFYDRAADSTQLPKYLLLFGRGSYNLKSTSNNTNYVPAYESLNSIDPTISYPGDDFYGMLDSAEGNWDVTNDVLDLGIGRLPVQSVSEAETVVEKIRKYTSVPGTIETGNSCSSDKCYGLGDWMNVISFCADDEDSGDHEHQADAIATKIDTTHGVYNIDKIYFDAYQQVSTPGGERYPDATASMNRRMEKGSLIMNYTGHGGELGWAHERFLEIHDINAWKNQCKLPLFFTATCEFSRWDDPARTSAGELTLLNPEGGSIGLMSTTRVVYSQPNAVLNDHFYNYTFVPMANGNMPRL